MREQHPTNTPPEDPLLRLATTPAARWLAAAAAGITLAANLNPHHPTAWFIAAAALALPALILNPTAPTTRRTIARATTLLAIAALAAAWFTLRTHHAPHHDLRNLLPPTTPAAQAPLLRIDATLLTPLNATPRQAGMLADTARYNPTVTRAAAKVHAVTDNSATRPATGNVWLRIDADTPALLSPGDRFSALARLAPLAPPNNPGQHDIRLYAHPRGIVATATIASPDTITRTPAPASITRSIRNTIHAIRARAANTLTNNTDTEPTAANALLAALLLGDRSDPAYDQLAEPFARTGVAHVLAISGLHVAIACALVAALVRLTGPRPRLETIAVAIAVIALLTLIPARPPITRAATIALVFAAAHLSARRYDPLQLLALTAIALLFHQPASLLDPGFQLTFTVTAALILFTNPLTKRLNAIATPHHQHHPKPSTTNTARRLVTPLLAVATVAWLASAPLTATHFANVPLASVPMSIITLPFITLIIALGYPALILNATPLAPLAEPLTLAALATAETLAALVNTADTLRGSELRLPHIPPPLALAWAAALFLIARRVTRDPWARLQRPPLPTHLHATLRTAAPLALAALIAATALHLATATRLPATTLLRLDTLAVGDGNTHILRTHHTTIIIDAGSTDLAAGQRRIPQAARALGVRSATRAIVTHADLDHFAAIPDAARELNIRELITTPQLLHAASTRPNSTEARFIQLITKQGITVTTVAAGDTIPLSPHTTAHVLHPPADATFDKDNQASLVLAIHTTTTPPDGPRPRPTLLLTADAEGPALDAIANHTFPDAPIITDAPHHGSANQHAVRTITQLKPHTVIQSTGPRRINNDAWNPLRKRTNWLTTATHGHIAATINRDGTIRTNTHHDPPS